MIEDRTATFTEQVAFTGATVAEAEAEVAGCDRLDGLVRRLGGQVRPDPWQPQPGGRAVLQHLGARSRPGSSGSWPRQLPSLLGLLHRVLPVIVSGNTAVVIASERWPVPAVSLTEVFATSDLPGGVVNLLTGPPAELTPFLAGHMDVDGIDLTGADTELAAAASFSAAENVKRVVVRRDPLDRSPYFIADFTETKTVWHPKGL